YIELYRPLHQTSDREDSHDVERGYDRRNLFDHREASIPDRIPCVSRDAEVKIDIGIVIGGAVRQTPLQPSRKKARVGREDLADPLNHVSASFGEGSGHADSCKRRLTLSGAQR